MPDPRSKWILWAGAPDSAFLDSYSVRAVRDFRYFGYSLVLFITFCAMGIYYLIRRNFDVIQRNNIELDRKVNERTVEIQRLAAEQERQKQLATQERQKDLNNMADSLTSFTLKAASYTTFMT